MDKSNQLKSRLLLIIPELRLQLQLCFMISQTSSYGLNGDLILSLTRHFQGRVSIIRTPILDIDTLLITSQ